MWALKLLFILGWSSSLGLHYYVRSADVVNNLQLLNYREHIVLALEFQN